jgi:hypothetical protein
MILSPQKLEEWLIASRWIAIGVEEVEGRTGTAKVEIRDCVHRYTTTPSSRLTTSRKSSAYSSNFADSI